MKISIIIPVYNGGGTLKYCLDSIKNQTYLDFEVLLVDDGSTDDSASICKSYTETDTRFKYFWKQNGGQIEARNFGIDHACGEFITFVDQDDLLHSDMYKILVKDAENNNAMVASIGYIKDFRDYKVINNSLNDKYENTTLEIFTSSDDALKAITREINPMAGMVWNKIYSRSIVGSLKFNLEAPLVDDAEFTLHLFSNNFISTYRNVVMYHWVQHKDNQTTTSNFEKYYKAALTYEKLVQYTKNSSKEVNEKIINQYMDWLMMSFKRLYKFKKKDCDFVKFKNEIFGKLKNMCKYKYVLNKKRYLTYMLICDFRPIYSLLIKLGF